MFCGPSMVFTNITKPRSFAKGSKFYNKTLVKKSASIGANATILCGNTIGKYSMIGTLGPVVTKSIPDFALVLGNPAKIIGWVDFEGSRAEFSNNGLSKCGRFIFDDDLGEINGKSLNIATIIGARPQFIKAAVISEKINNENLFLRGLFYSYRATFRKKYVEYF